MAAESFSVTLNIKVAKINLKILTLVHLIFTKFSSSLIKLMGKSSPLGHTMHSLLADPDLSTKAEYNVSTKGVLKSIPQCIIVK